MVEAIKAAVCKLPSLRDMARGLRRWLLKANVDRVQLHTGSSVSKPLRWHDTRATGLTWLAVEGASPSVLRDIAGHTQTAMTDRYVRAAGVLRGGRFGDPFPPLAPLLGQAKREPSEEKRSVTTRILGGADGTRTRGLLRDRQAL